MLLSVAACSECRLCGFQMQNYFRVTISSSNDKSNQCTHAVYTHGRVLRWHRLEESPNASQTTTTLFVARDRARSVKKKGVQLANPTISVRKPHQIASSVLCTLSCMVSKTNRAIRGEEREKRISGEQSQLESNLHTDYRIP